MADLDAELALFHAELAAVEQATGSSDQPQQQQQAHHRQAPAVLAPPSTGPPVAQKALPLKAPPPQAPPPVALPLAAVQQQQQQHIPVQAPPMVLPPPPMPPPGMIPPPPILQQPPMMPPAFHGQHMQGGMGMPMGGPPGAFASQPGPMGHMGGMGMPMGGMGMGHMQQQYQQPMGGGGMPMQGMGGPASGGPGPSGGMGGGKQGGAGGQGGGDGKGGDDKKRKAGYLRLAGGEKWIDPSLDEWPENDFRIFVGDLGTEVTDELLARSFKQYSSFAKAKIVRDKRTKKSKGFGFVSFLDSNDFAKALREMNGKYIGNRPCKLSKSTWDERTLKKLGPPQKKQR